MSKLVWFRRDLRLHDHPALSEALSLKEPVYLCFNFDPVILNKLAQKRDQRISFIIDSLKEMEKKLQEQYQSTIFISYGAPEEEIPKLAQNLKVDAVYLNRDYEPYAKKRDKKTQSKLKKREIELKSFKDHVHFESDQVLKDDGSPYQVFTPYKKRWLSLFKEQDSTIPCYKMQLKNLAKVKNKNSILNTDWYKNISFAESSSYFPAGREHGKKLLQSFGKRITDYQANRDSIDKNGTSNLSVYLRHGCLSIRDLLRLATENKSLGHQTWLSELIWREFYQMILDCYPHVETKAFKEKYQKMSWPGSEKLFKAWCEGRTGFPIIDAAMRCLNQTGTMHNRLRMITASFLCKTLLVDWRKGEKYFAEKLLDYDLAANNGGWQWSASTGCDAQPYFRIFNPYTQQKKFDPENKFIKKWLPELDSQNYPAPIMDYKDNREKGLNLYKKYYLKINLRHIAHKKKVTLLMALNTP